MWIDICIHAWYYLPKGIKQTRRDDNLHLMYYALFAFGVPLILVILTYKHKLSGLPSYYIKGTTRGVFKLETVDKRNQSTVICVPYISFHLPHHLINFSGSSIDFLCFTRFASLSKYLKCSSRSLSHHKSGPFKAFSFCLFFSFLSIHSCSYITKVLHSADFSYFIGEPFALCFIIFRLQAVAEN